MNISINWLDVLIVLALIGGMFLGGWQGAIRQLLGLGALYAAIGLSSRLYPNLADRIVELSPRMVTTVADVIAFFALLFLLGLVFTFLLFDLLRGLTQRPVTPLGRVAGGAVGFVAAAVLVTVSLVALTFMTLATWPTSSEWLRQGLIDARVRSNLVIVFRALVPLLLQALRPFGGNLPPMFSVDLNFQ